MIIRDDGDSLLFITQPDHAHLAGDTIAHWRADGFPNHPRRDLILLAAREHDNGWIEEDASTHVDQEGTPLDFVSVPVAVRHRIWPRAAGRMAATSPYAAALIAQHALAVYSATRSDPGWEDFFRTMTERRDALLARSEVDATTFERDYRFVNAADRISLAFCTGWHEPLESHGRRIILTAQNTVEITPDPFAGAQIPLRIRARRLPRRRYESSSSLRQALDEAPVGFLEGTVLGVA
jgi:hypothetical protein